MFNYSRINKSFRDVESGAVHRVFVITSHHARNNETAKYDEYGEKRSNERDERSGSVRS